MTEQSSFNAAEFLQGTIDQPMDTEYQLCPEGKFQAMIADFDEKACELVDFTFKKGPNAGQPGSMVKFNLPFSIQDDAVKAQMGRDTVHVEYQLILDRDNLGQLDWSKGKNVKLGQVRDAVGQNVSGPWSIFNLRGAGPCYVNVVHETYRRKDGTDGTAARVNRVVSAK